MRKTRPGRSSARSLMARVLVFALILPTAFSLTAPDPHWLLGIEPATQPAGVAHAHPAGTPAHEHRASPIPGSPDHPADHNCSPCQVLKYLASYLPQLPFVLPARAPVAFPPVERDAAQRAGLLASLPPSRAPPRAA
jgi:hypothetical protein